MKFKFVMVTVFIMLLCSGAYAQEETYIVRFNDSVQMYDAEKNQGINFAVATADELQEYIDAGIVEDYEPNYEVFAIETYAEETEETVSDVVANWNFNMVNAAFSYKLGALGNEVKVAVIDSGLCSDDMIRAQILDGYDFITDKKTDEYVNNDNADGIYHGTIVSSVIARQNIGYGTGIAARAHIMPLRVLSYDETKKVNTGSLNDIIDAIEYATYTDKCDVINMSLGIKASGISSEELTTLSTAIQNAVDNGIIVIAAAGNEGSSEYMYPASLDNVISVASVDSDATHSEFSQYNDKVFISAPGGLMQISILYRVQDGKETASLYTTKGTSVAAPHVSALAAIAKCINPQINMEQFKQLLENTSGKTQRDDYYGYGIINCEAAIKKLIEGRALYLSPVAIITGTDGDYTGVMSMAVIYNNTQEPLSATVMYGLYNADKTLENVMKFPVGLPAGEKMNVNVPYSNGTVKYMAWDGFENMIPLAQSSQKQK